VRTNVKRINVSLESPPRTYQIQIGRDTLTEAARVIRRSLGPHSRRVVLVSNRKVLSLYGSSLLRDLQANDFNVSSFLMGDGERYKSLATANKALQFFSIVGLERTDAVLALGGGVVGDLAGFAAATYLRGVPLIHVPTTIIAQIDSAIGGKTGVNLPKGKNLVGSFHQPSAVIVDVATLQTLPAREVAAGWFEAVKNGAVGGRKLFQQTTTFLKSFKSSQEQVSAPALTDLIKSHCAYKVEVVKRDEREDPTRTDRHSRRVLNFGHTIAHALEAVTNYRRFRHGEAVGHGMRVAGLISKNLGLLSLSELESLREAIRLCGPLPSAADLDPKTILQHVRNDKKHFGGSVQWVLLEKVGKPRIVPGSEVPTQLIRDSLRQSLQ
jgi:3-dehydroquinate synthase